MMSIKLFVINVINTIIAMKNDKTKLSVNKIIKMIIHAIIKIWIIMNGIMNIKVIMNAMTSINIIIITSALTLAISSPPSPPFFFCRIFSFA